MRIFKQSIWIVGILLLSVTCVGAAGEVRVSMEDALKNAVNKPTPEYSAMAQQMKVTGKVDVEAVIAADGSVEAVKVLTGNPLLTNSAVTAVKTWKFTPFTSNGEPARAVAVLSFDFKR